MLSVKLYRQVITILLLLVPFICSNSIACERCERMRKGIMTPQEKFFRLVFDGKTEKVKTALKKDPSLASFVDWHVGTPLHAAAREGNLEMAKLFVSYGTPINHNDNFDENTALHEAARAKHYDMFMFLINKGADLNKKNRDGYTPLNLALNSGKYELVKYSLNKGLKVNEIIYGYPPIYYAVKEGSIDCVKYLISKGADFGRKDLIKTAAQEGHLKLVKFFIEIKEPYRGRIFEGKNLLQYAVESGNIELVKFLVSKGLDVNSIDKTYGTTPIFRSIYLDDSVVFKYLMSKGASLNKKDFNDSTLLHYAAKNGRSETVKILIKNGAKLNSRNLHGDTSLHNAVIGGDQETLKILLSSGANVNATNKDIRTPLHKAVLRKKMKIVKLLIIFGADPNVKDHREETPLYLMSKDCTVREAKFLVDRGASIKIKNNMGYNCLHRAVAHKNLELVKFYLSKGIDVNEGYYAKPIDFAFQNNDKDMIKYLYSQGASTTFARFHKYLFEPDKEILFIIMTRDRIIFTIFLAVILLIFCLLLLIGYKSFGIGKKTPET